MMLDDDVVAVSPSSVYRTLKRAGRLDQRQFSPSKKGTGFVQPLEHYNHVRLNSAIGNLTPADKLNGLAQLIFDERDRNLKEARQRRQQARQALREVA